MSSTIARNPIPITHYRILAKQQPAATARPVAKQSLVLATPDRFYVAIAMADLFAGRSAKAIVA
jgi:hypothetical protein